MERKWGTYVWIGARNTCQLFLKKCSPFSRVKSAGNGIERLLCCLGAYQEIELVQALIFLLGHNLVTMLSNYGVK